MLACIRDGGDAGRGEGYIVDADPFGADSLEECLPQVEVVSDGVIEWYGAAVRASSQ